MKLDEGNDHNIVAMSKQKTPRFTVGVTIGKGR